MPRRVIAVEYTGPEALRLEETDPLGPGEGQVVIAVRAAALNPADGKGIQGQWGADLTKLPLRPGSEVAGVVTAVGGGVTAPRVGDAVVAFRVVGGWADEVRTSAANAFRLPADADLAQAAGLLLAGTTAWHLLEATGLGAGTAGADTAAGRTVIVHGASGAVGELAVQLAVLRGARVVGTASERNQDAVRALGAEPVVYGPGLEQRLRALLPDGADAALDTVGTDEAIDTSLALTGDRSRVATIAAFARGAEAGIHLLGGGPGADPGSALRAAARGPLVDLFARGALRVRVADGYPLERAREALERVMSGHPGGKVLLVPTALPDRRLLG
ncbi:MAG: zinc-binding dehydrogenase [Micrococcales bacterium]|nr:zinc-binding dehydrogenase [Micrococcales bacterium]